MPNIIGQSLGRYHILEQLGEGGMAIVYKAFDTTLKRHCAIKFMRAEKLGSSKAIQRFRTEAEALAQLEHPNIVKILDFGEMEGTPYLVMEYVPGGTLKKRLGAAIPWEEAITLITPIVEALAHAHKKKIIHRDVKPSNILVAKDGRLLLSDFGVAKILELDETSDFTGTGVGVGTPEYMAPEQGRGEKVDQRADIYALGVILYELITARKPFQADTPMAVIYQHVNDPLPRPRKFIPSLPDNVEAFLQKTLEKKPEHRYQDLDKFIEDLRNLSAGRKIKARHQKSRLNILYILLFGGAFFVIGLLTFFLILLLRMPTGSQAAAQLQDLPGAETKEVPLVLTVDVIESPTINPLPTAIPSPTKAAGFSNVVIYMTDAMGGVYVPAGEFIMGAFDSDQIAGPNEKPEHTVYLDTFIIDSFEVTNAMYKKCISAGACQAPLNTSSLTRQNYLSDKQYDEFPVTHIDWGMAAAYCSWAGRRLPTEAEWEKAARGTIGQIFPWGGEFDCKFGNFADCIGDTTKNRSYHEGKSLYDVYDMAGNVWEWTADWYDPGFYLDSPLKNPAGPGPGTEKVLRGGSFRTESKFVRTTYRRAFNPDSESDDIGIRCADSVENK